MIWLEHLAENPILAVAMTGLLWADLLLICWSLATGKRRLTLIAAILLTLVLYPYKAYQNQYFGDSRTEACGQALAFAAAAFLGCMAWARQRRKQAGEKGA